MTRLVALATTVAFAAIGAFAATAILSPTTEPTGVVLFGAATASAVLVGLLLVVRAPGNRIGPLLLATGTLLVTAYACGQYAQAGAAETPPRAGVAIASMASDTLFILPIVLALVVIPLVFPTGHLLSPRWRWILWLLVVALTAQAVAFVIGDETVAEIGVPNPFHIPGLEMFAQWLGAFSSVTSIIGFGSAAAAVWIRYRRGDVVERQQVKWLLAVAGVAAICFPVAFIVPVPDIANVAFVLGVIAMIAMPIAIAVAILRYRLYEIDRIVSRTLSYAIVTGILAAVFVGVILLLQTALAGALGGGGVPVAISTLAVFALFQPVMRRVRRSVDRRFDRTRFDGERTAGAFAERLRWETDMERVTGDLRTTVADALAPSGLGIWLRDGRIQR